MTTTAQRPAYTLLITTAVEDRALRRLCGEDGSTKVEIVARGDVKVTGEGGYHTTPSGKTIVHHPGAYGWRTVYHCSTRAVEIPAKLLAQLRALVGEGKILFDAAALPREIAVRHDGKVTRYGLRGSRLVRTGVAVRMPADLASFGRYEHATSLRGCAVEIKRKRKTVAAARKLALMTARNERRARLLARVSARLTANFEDARACGFCAAGISAWAAERGVSLDSSVSLTTLAHDSDRRAQAVALLVARKFIAAQ
jgi:hypothetical protein